MAEREKPGQDSRLLGFSVMSFGSAVTAILAYFRFAQITSIFGANWRTDALAVATVFPQMVTEVVAHSFGSSFIPIYSRVIEHKGHENGVRFVNRILSWLFVVGLLFIAVLWFSSYSLVRIISPNGSPELLELAETLLRIVLPIVIIGPFNGILRNFIKYEKRFRILPVSGMLNLLVSLGIILFVKDALSVHILPISMLAGGFSEFLYLLYHCYRSGFKLNPSMDSDPHMGQLARMSFPVVLGTVIGFFSPIADKMLASFLPESSVTAIDYANRIKTIVLSIVFGPFLVFADLDFSAEAAKGRLDSLLVSLRKSMNRTSLVMIPTASLLSVLAVPMVSVFFQRGNLTGENVRYIGYALAFYAPWLAQYGLGALISRTFYAQKDSRTPVIIGIFGVVTNVFLNLILVGPLGIGGLALATTITSTAKTAYLTWSLSRKMGGLNLKLIVLEHLKMITASLLAVLACLGLNYIWVFTTDAPFMTRLLQLTAYSIAGITMFTGWLQLTRCTTFQDVKNVVMLKIKKK